MDIWVAVNKENSTKLVRMLIEFGMPENALSEAMFLEKKRVIRMGVPPVRIELLTGISGVDFATCFKRREVVVIDGIQVNIISLEDLKANKKAAGRHGDLKDLERLP